MVTDYIRRLMIVAAIAAFLGVLFIGSKNTLANTVLDDELINSLIWPTEGVITDTYGTRWGKHYGIDIAAPQGTPIYAIDDGVVNRSFYSDSYGNVIFIAHGNGLETVYAHLHKRYVKEGDIVGVGEEIGTVGNTGRSTGDHLHFEVHIGSWNIEKSNSIDPMLVLLDPNVNLAAQKKEAEYKAVLSNRITIVNNDEIQMEDQYVRYGFETQVASSVLDVESESQNEEKEVIVVQEQDTLWSISNEYHVTIEDVKTWNELETDVLHLGQELKIYPYQENIYFVKEGDTINQIAQDLGISISQLKELNDLDNHLIYPGESLKIKDE